MSSAKYAAHPSASIVPLDNAERARLRVVQADQLAPLFLEIGDTHVRQRLERADEVRLRPARTLGDTPFLAAIARQKHHNPVRFAELVGSENERVRAVEGHLVGALILPRASEVPGVERRQSKEGCKAAHVGKRRNEDRRGERRIDFQRLQPERNQRARRGPPRTG